MTPSASPPWPTLSSIVSWRTSSESSCKATPCARPAQGASAPRRLGSPSSVLPRTPDRPEGGELRGLVRPQAGGCAATLLGCTETPDWVYGFAGIVSSSQGLRDVPQGATHPDHNPQGRGRERI